ncbi:g3816 [Coccomyxa elongata]
MSLTVEKWDSGAYGELSKPAMLRKLQDEGYDTTVYTFGPGTVFGEHSHSMDKKDAILGGKFLFRMGGDEVILEPGDQLEVPKGKTHYAACVGSEAVTFVDASRY